MYSLYLPLGSKKHMQNMSKISAPGGSQFVFPGAFVSPHFLVPLGFVLGFIQSFGFLTKTLFSNFRNAIHSLDGLELGFHEVLLIVSNLQCDIYHRPN